MNQPPLRPQHSSDSDLGLFNFYWYQHALQVQVALSLFPQSLRILTMSRHVNDFAGTPIILPFTEPPKITKCSSTYGPVEMGTALWHQSISPSSRQTFPCGESSMSRATMPIEKGLRAFRRCRCLTCHVQSYMIPKCQVLDSHLSHRWFKDYKIFLPHIEFLIT